MSNSRERLDVDRIAETPYIGRLAFVLWGTILYWVSLPPLNFWPVAFLVPVVWAVLIGRPESPRYRWIYLSAFFFWIASIWWIACPHPLTSLGLLALAGYLSIYWPLFIWTSRIAVHRFRIPIVLATPICWMGCEYLRFHLLGGFSFCSLQHALYLKPKFIQIAEIGGEYLVGGMIMLVGTGFAVPLIHALLHTSEHEKRSEKKPGFFPVGFASGILAVTVLLAAVFYDSSWFRGWLSGELPIVKGETVRIATLQGNIPVQLNGDPELPTKTYRQFLDLTYSAVVKAREEGKPLDLVVWPETVCPIPLLEFQDEKTESRFDETMKQACESYKEHLSDLQRGFRKLGVSALLGMSTFSFRGDEEPIRLNSALLFRPKIETTDRYDKVHLVMFGEYIPFSQYLPKNFFLTTLCQEAGRGTGPVAMPLGNDWMSVNICFESSVPHLIRGQVLTLKKQGKNPAVLVNMSNDGWFRFSQQIDQHLATHVFRAVENGRPYLTATNGGFAAWINHRGTIQAIGQRRTAEAVLGNVSVERLSMTPYHRIGDWPVFVCMLVTVSLPGIQWIVSRRNRQAPFTEQATT